MGPLKSNYLLDSVILIDHLQGKEKATRWLSQLKDQQAVISVISRAEVLVGTSPENFPTIKVFLDQYDCLSLTPAIAEMAAILRQKHHWKPPDAFQAALAINHNLMLITRNTKDFNSRQHNFVLIPYRL